MSKNTTNTTKKWLNFFSEAGLPSSVATNYAMIFTEHRIQNDMLSDLTKEILYDMGIKTMGDVIAILRQAKTVTHNKTRDQLLGYGLEPSEIAVSKPAANNQPQRTLTHRFKTTVSAPDSTQNPNSNAKIVSLKRSAESSGLVKTNPKMRKIVVNEDDDDLNGLNDDIQGLSKGSVFHRLGAEKNSSIFSRLGGTVGTDPINQRRKVTIGGNSIDTTVQNRISFNSNNNSLLVTKTVAKRPILPPNSTQMRSSRQNEPLSVKDRIGVVRTNKTLPASNRLVVNRSANTSKLAMNRVNTSGSSSAVAQAKRFAMIREVKAVNTNKRTTISLRKNIFDRLGPISL